jgi:hypothetical protein
MRNESRWREPAEAQKHSTLSGLNDTGEQVLCLARGSPNSEADAVKYFPRKSFIPEERDFLSRNARGP